MKKNISFNECKSYEDIKVIVLTALEYDEVVENEAAARQWFKNAEIGGEVISREVMSEQVSIWNEEMNGEELYGVCIYEYYVDSGSADYVYSYVIDSL